MMCLYRIFSAPNIDGRTKVEPIPKADPGAARAAPTVDGRYKVTPDPSKSNPALGNIPGSARYPGTTPPTVPGSDILGTLNGANNEINQIGGEIDRVTQEAQRIIADITGGKLLEDALGDLLGTDLGKILKPQDFLNDIVSDLLGGFGLKEIFSVVDAIKGIAKNVETIFAKLKNIPSALQIPTFGQMLRNQVEVAMGPINQAQADFMQSLEGATDIEKLRTTITNRAESGGQRDDIRGPATVNQMSEEQRKEWAIPDAQDAGEILVAEMVGRCDPNNEGEVEPDCVAASIALGKQRAVNLARNQAIRSQIYLAGLDTFRRKFIFGDELSGECKDFEKDEACQTIIGFMSRSSNLRQDIMVQSAINYTSLLMSMLQLEAAAQNKYTEGALTVYETAAPVSNF